MDKITTIINKLNKSQLGLLSSVIEHKEIIEIFRIYHHIPNKSIELIKKPLLNKINRSV